MLFLKKYRFLHELTHDRFKISFNLPFFILSFSISVRMSGRKLLEGMEFEAWLLVQDIRNTNITFLSSCA